MKFNTNFSWKRNKFFVNYLQSSGFHLYAHLKLLEERLVSVYILDPIEWSHLARAH